MKINNPIIKSTVAITDLIATLPGLRQQHTVINPLAWCAVVLTKTLNDYLVISPNWGALAPIGSAAPLLKLNLKQEQCNEYIN
ncbi:MAG: hypothetical protein O2971_05855 [Proteobacteria bacterium]|nr:hypothetical protein [Pseudomonadota bacterium]